MKSNPLIQGSPEWLADRKKGIGSSEIAAVIGQCKYSTPYQVWLVKTGRAKEFAGNWATEHGKEFEPKARARYELLSLDDMPPACGVHPVYEICRASFDGLRMPDMKKTLEIKCPGKESHALATAGVIPPHYIPQSHWQMAVAGSDEHDFFSWHEDTQTHAIVTLAPDVEYQGMLIAKALEFWSLYVLTDTPPPLSDRDVKIIDHDSQIIELCNRLKETKDAIKKPALDKLKAEIVKLAGHPKMRCGDVQISVVNRSGKFSYHKLTISEGESA